MDKKLPVTVLSGFLGSGKITQQLQRCLLLDGEVRAYLENQEFSDPFPGRL